MKNIVLTGFMGTGKTAVGKELARVLHMKLVDVDQEIERSQKMSINDIFSSFGEPHFRDVETAVIRSVSIRNNVVISTGGGAVLREENMETLRRGGEIFCLTASPSTILQRTRNSDERPLLKVDDPEGRIRELLEIRRPFYEKAGVLIQTDGKTPHQVALEIMEVLKCRK